MCHLHLLNVYYANCFKVKEPNAPLHFRSIPCIDIVSAAEWKVVLEGRVDVRCSRGLGEPQRPMLDARQAEHGLPRRLPPVPSPCAFSRDKSNGLFSTHLGRWVTLGKKAGPQAAMSFLSHCHPGFPPARRQPCSCWGSFLSRGRGPPECHRGPQGLQGTRDVSCIAPRTLCFRALGSSWVSGCGIAVPA